MAKVVLFNKPYGVLCQFSRDAGGRSRAPSFQRGDATPQAEVQRLRLSARLADARIPQAGTLLTARSRDGDRPCLADYLAMPGVYPAGRLDADSEGLVVLTADGALQARIADPAHKLPKTYWAQVEGVPDEAALARLRSGVDLSDFHTQPAQARRIDEPPRLWLREPPVRFRKAIPTAWIELVLREGKNRQVRRMTAKVGFPTLRLIRAAVGPWQLEKLQPGQWREAKA